MDRALIHNIVNKDELVNCLQEFNNCLNETYKECLEVCFDSSIGSDNCKFKIGTVLDFLHDELNTGHWSLVPVSTRRAFSAVSFVKAVLFLKCSSELTAKTLQDALKCIDTGLLLGAPLKENCDLLTLSASLLSQKLLGHDSSINNMQTGVKRKSFSNFDDLFESINAKEVDTVACPSVDCFNTKYFLPEIPVKLQDCINHWPAISKWNDINYLLGIAGDRTVPVEIGSHYIDENWSQKLMTLRNFIKDHYLGNSKAVGYLAQHNLFDQITELKKDISTPDYCCLSRDYEKSCEPDVNAWFGPENTVSPLHYDPKDNLLTQVYGIKQVLLFSPSDSEYLYPHEGKLLFNTAQVDPVDPDLKRFPNFVKAAMYKCMIEPADILYIPRKWWHHVTAIEKSFSVSFWWE